MMYYLVCTYLYALIMSPILWTIFEIFVILKYVVQNGVVLSKMEQLTHKFLHKEKYEAVCHGIWGDTRVNRKIILDSLKLTLLEITRCFLVKSCTHYWEYIVELYIIFQNI